jgi:hypothetical protein
MIGEEDTYYISFPWPVDALFPDEIDTKVVFAPNLVQCHFFST